MSHTESVPDHVPELAAKSPSLFLRALGALSPGVAAVSDQVELWTRWWSDQNQAAVTDDGPLVVVIGDSTALGIGATHPANGYVGRIMAALDAERPANAGRWRVINLAQSGAKMADGLERQLPIARNLPQPDVVVCCLGTNDLVWGIDTSGIRRQAATVIGELAGIGAPAEQSVACSLAGASARARLINRTIRKATGEHELIHVNPWAEPGPSNSRRLASDKFHPNDLGYALMATAIGRPLGLEAGTTSWWAESVPATSH